MIRIKLLLLLLFPLAAISQMLPATQWEAVVQKEPLTTEPVILKKASGVDMRAYVMVAGDSLFLTLMGSGKGTGTVDKGNETALTLENNSVISIQSIALQGFDSRGFVNTYQHSYHLSLEDLETLSRYRLQRVKKFSMDEYYEVEVEEKQAEELRAQCAFFLQELYKRGLLAPLIKPTAAAFPGGKPVFLQFLNRNLKRAHLPESGKEHTAQIQFRVGAAGSISDIEVRSSAGPVFTNELQRVLKRMPKWKPASEKGKNIDAIVTQTLSLRVQDSGVYVDY